MSGMMFSRATRVNVGRVDVPPCRITSAVPSQLLPTNSTGTVSVGRGPATAAGESDAATMQAASINAARKTSGDLLRAPLTDTECLFPITAMEKPENGEWLG